MNGREKTYDGLYRITRAWKERGKDYFVICRQAQSLQSCNDLCMDTVRCICANRWLMTTCL